MQFPHTARAERPGLTRVLDAPLLRSDQSFHRWDELVQSACGPVRVAGERRSPFHGRITRRAFGTIHTSSIQADAHSVERDLRLIERAGETPLFLCAVLEGAAHVVQGHRAATARAGDLLAFDSALPYSLAMHEPIRMVVVKFPHPTVGLTMGEPHPLMAATWSGQCGVGGLLLDLLSGLEGQLTSISEVSADPLGEGVKHLISAVVAERLSDGMPESQLARQSLLLRVQQFAREHLGDPDLSPTMLARRHKVSLRYLQLLFNKQNTSPARWIREERLARCQEDLRSPRFAHLTVASVGERWGLLGASHFSRLFRERYGVTPSEWRRAEHDVVVPLLRKELHSTVIKMS